MHKIPKERQRLYFVGEELKDNRRLSDYNIGWSSLLSLTHNIEIKVTGGYRRKTITVIAELTDSILDLKCTIRNKTEIEPHNQSLTYDGERLEDRKTIAFYDIKDQSTVNLVQHSYVKR